MDEGTCVCEVAKVKEKGGEGEWAGDALTDTFKLGDGLTSTLKSKR